ncbi:MAG: hypothetical protein V4754_01780 [Pseudomonadota bacterium]
MGEARDRGSKGEREINSRRKPKFQFKTKKIQNDDFTVDEVPQEYWLRQLRHLWNKVIGRKWWGLLIAAIIFVPPVLYQYIISYPGYKFLAEKLDESGSLPQAKGDRMSIVLARLDNDKTGSHRRLIFDGLASKFNDEIEILLIDRTIETRDSDKPQQAILGGHERARELLKKINADVIIWGETFDDKIDSPIRVHWTTNDDVKLKKSNEKYSIDEKDLDLPILFWSDLKDVLGLLSYSQSLSLRFLDGGYVAEKMELFSRRVERLASSGKIQGIQQIQLQLSLALALRQIGAERGDAESLKKSISIYRQLDVYYSKEGQKIKWAKNQNLLGRALGALGGIKKNRAYLEEAISCYENALTIYTFKAKPHEWSIISVRKASLYIVLEENQRKLGRLEEVVSITREALGQLSSDNDYIERSSALSTLSQALTMLGERDNDPEKLLAALFSFQAVLETIDVEKNPVAWGHAQGNLATALVRVARYENGPSNIGVIHLEQAINYYKAAILKLPRDKTPFYFAQTQNQLGDALFEAGQRHNQSNYIKESIIAHRTALEILSKDRAPLDWGRSQLLLGRALSFLAEFDKDISVWREAEVAYRLALEVLSMQSSAYFWAFANMNLAVTLIQLERYELKKFYTNEAKVMLNNAKIVFTKSAYPVHYNELNRIDIMLKIGDQRKN